MANQKSSKSSQISNTKTRKSSNSLSSPASTKSPRKSSSQTSSKPSRKSPSKTSKINSRLTILMVIIIAVIAVGFALIFTFLNRPEHAITSRIESLTRHYYEDIYYETMLNAPQFSGDPEKSLAKYSDFGLNPISLEQLILTSDTVDPSATTYFSEYCDLSRTSVTIYPESPYTKNSYHFSITYSCNF